MSQIDNFLGRLSKVRKSGNKSWRACCPGHNGKHANLSVREADDGRVLVKCHSHGCGIEEIAVGAGVQVSDLMPESTTYHRKKPHAVRFNSRDVLACVRDDAYALGFLITDLAKGKSPTPEALVDGLKAAGRLIAAADLADV